jgi:nucleotide-binding universal stress UspA family protein
MILVCYDGSEDSEAAIDSAARLFPGASVKVITVWEPFVDMMIRSGAMGSLGGIAGAGHAEEIDEASRGAALSRATEGAARCSAAGLDAAPVTTSRHLTVADTILEAASELDAGVILMGSRGLGGVKSMLLGSVSHDVLQHADRPVLVVPSPAVAGRRHHEITDRRATAGEPG